MKLNIKVASIVLINAKQRVKDMSINRTKMRVMKRGKEIKKVVNNRLTLNMVWKSSKKELCDKLNEIADRPLSGEPDSEKALQIARIFLDEIQERARKRRERLEMVLIIVNTVCALLALILSMVSVNAQT